MKYSLLHKTFSSLLLSMFLSAAIFCGNASESRAAELVTVTGDSSGILQAGGLLEEEPNQGIMLLSLETDYTGASKALEHAFANFQTTVDLSSYCIKTADLPDFYQDFVNNHPQYFYLNSSYSYNQYSGSDEVYQLMVSYTADTATLSSMVREYNNKVDEVVASADSSWSDLEKVLYINDYLAVNCEYDTSLEKHNAYNALVEQTAVCQGYALAFQELAGKLGVTSGYVSSNTLNHAWNVAKINGAWYHVDTTWDDPVKDRYGRARHAYLLKSTSWFKSPSTQDSAHNAEDYIYYSSSDVSEPTNTDYDAYFWNNIDSPFGYYNGYWYANNSQTIKKYSGSSSGLQEYSTVKTLTFRWYTWGSTSSYWPGAYSGCIFFGNKLYYASPTSIQAIDLTTGQDADIATFTLSDSEQSEGYIYGFYITSDGTLKYGIAQSPNDAAARKEAALHTHSYGEWSVTKAPTCTEEGEKTQTCSECGYSIKETIDATGHTPGAAATCTTPQTCTVCSTVIAEATGHSYNSGVITTQPTCAKEGIKTFTCTVCDDSYTETVAKTTAHSFGNWITVTESTCQSEGTQQRTCSVCGSTEEQSIAKTAHTPGAAATCTTPQTCTVCSTVIAEATGHSYDSGVITTQPTCAKEGIKTFTCTVCNDSYTETVAKTTAHSFGNWTTVTDSTCQAEGKQQRICSVCGSKEEKTIAKKAHTPGAAATCTTPQTCTVCNTVIANATGHSYNNGVITAQPTCTKEGVKTFTCTKCKTSYTETVAKTTAHSFGNWTTVTDSTCQAEGKQQRICSVCGSKEERTIAKKAHTPGAAATCTTPQTCTVCNTVIANATGHSYDSGVITTQPTCTKEGVKTFTCTKCKTSYTETVAKTAAHSFGNWTTVTDNTCQAEGKQQRICSVCGLKEERTIAKKAHTPGAAATCTTPQTCTVCNTVIANATGHLHTETKTVKKATFLKTGKASVVCKDCKTTLRTKTLAKIKCKKGQTYTVGNYKYKIVSAKINGKGTVAFMGLAKNVKTVKIGDTATILGAKFKITQIAPGALKNKTSVTSVTIGKNVQTIGKNAFYGTKKLKTITIKSTKITKVGTKALQNINAKAKIKVPKAKLKKYTSLFKNKGQKKTVKIY